MAAKPDELEALPGHLRLIGLEDLSEAGYTVPKRVYCAAEGCQFWHTDGSRFCAGHQQVRGSTKAGSHA